MTRMLILLSLSCIALTACESKPDAPPTPESASAEPTTPEATPTEEAATPERAESDATGERKILNPFATHQLASKAIEAMGVTRKMSDGARMYFTSEQRFSAPDGDTPWHLGTEDGDRMSAVGMPLAWANYVFPGGVSFSMTTHSELPKGGKKAALTLDVSSPEIATVLRSMYLELEPETYFRYTYTTGPGKGDQATATIKAEADFDPSTPEIHTMVYELSVDTETQEVVVSEPVTTHKFH